MSHDSHGMSSETKIIGLVVAIIGVLIAACALGRDYFDWTWKAASSDGKGYDSSPHRASELDYPSEQTKPNRDASERDESSQPEQSEQRSKEGSQSPDTDLPQHATSPSPRVGPRHGGPLAVNVTLCCAAGKVGPNTWTKDVSVTGNITVYDTTGQLDKGCYVSWTLSREGEVVSITPSPCRSRGITLWAGERLSPGDYKLLTKVSTDWGVEGVKETAFTIVAGS